LIHDESSPEKRHSFGWVLTTVVGLRVGEFVGSDVGAYEINSTSIN
jgi:hypothetical protein